MLQDDIKLLKIKIIQIYKIKNLQIIKYYKSSWKSYF